MNFVVNQRPLKNSGLNGTRTLSSAMSVLSPELGYVSAVLFQLRCQANWKLVIMWVYDKPVDNGYTSDISFELRMETINAYDLRSYILLLEQ